MAPSKPLTALWHDVDPTLPQMLDQILPPYLRQSAVIAGGYAACPALAADIDVWVLVSPAVLRQARQDILIPLSDLDVHVAPENTREAMRVGENSLGYDELDFRVLKVATITGLGRLPFHIMVTDAPAPLALLCGFDLSTHQCVLIRGQGGFDRVSGPDWTPVNYPPVVLRETTQTPNRVAKLVARYQHWYTEKLHTPDREVAQPLQR